MKKICYYSIILHNTPTVWRNARKQRKKRKDKYILVHTHTKMFLYNNQTSTSLGKLINTISVSKFHFVYLSSQKKRKATHERRNSRPSTASLILRAGVGGGGGMGGGGV